MNFGLFRAQINKTVGLLKKLELLEQHRINPHYFQISRSEFRYKSYLEEWRFYYEKNLFDIQLTDSALIQFRINKSGTDFILSYAYYECPYNILSYKEFLREILESNYENVGDMFREEYNDYVLSCELKRSTTPIRYDFNSDSYNPGIHPSAHVHIGRANNIRISAQRIWLPVSFVLFVLRQCYPDQWKRIIKTGNPNDWIKIVRSTLDVAPHFFESNIDKMEVFLS